MLENTYGFKRKKVYIKLPFTYKQLKIHSKTLSAEIKIKTLNLRKYTLHNIKHIINKFLENANLFSHFDLYVALF